MRIALVVLAATACSGACSGAHHIEETPAPVRQLPPIELVESAPSETTLDHDDIPNAYRVWAEMIHDAKTSIDLGQFYVSNAPDGSGRLEPIVHALEAALARGVRVRLLVEQSFVKVYPDTLDRLAKAGAAVRHLHLDTGGILHAKYFVVDHDDAFVGSQNFDWRALEHNLELGARIHDPQLTRGLAAIFERDWAFAGHEEPPAATIADARGPIQLVASPKDLLPAGIAWDLPKLIALIDAATKTIHVQMLTYRAGDWDELEAPLLRAAARGVHVELMLADWSKRDKTLPGLRTLARMPNVEVRLVTIPPASTGFIPFARVIHAKVLVVDGAHAWLGTSNWEREYFYQSRNLGLVIEDPRIAARLDSFFTTAWSSTYAYRLDPDGAYPPPRIE